MRRLLPVALAALLPLSGCVWSNPSDAEPPGAPASLEAERGNGSVELSWSEPSDIGDSDISGYTITVIGPY